MLCFGYAGINRFGICIIISIAAAYLPFDSVFIVIFVPRGVITGPDHHWLAVFSICGVRNRIVTADKAKRDIVKICAADLMRILAGNPYLLTVSIFVERNDY